MAGYCCLYHALPCLYSIFTLQCCTCRDFPWSFTFPTPDYAIWSGLASPVFSVWQMVDSLFLYPLPLHSRLGPEDRPAPPSGQRVPATVRRSSGGSVGSQPRRPRGLRQGGRLWFGLHPAGPRPQTARPQPAGHPGHETLAAMPLVAQPAALRLQHPVAVEYLLPGGERADRWGRCGGSGRNK